MNLLGLQAVFLTESYENIVVSLGKVIDNTIDIRFDILWALQVEVLAGADMQRVSNAKVVPEELVHSRIFVNPNNFANWNNGISVI